MKKLIIGSKHHGHDSAIFIIDNEKKDIFGLSTERVTRFKHDYLPMYPALERFLEYYKINTKEIEEVIFATDYEIDMRKIFYNEYEFTLNKRNFLNVKYIKEYKNEMKKLKQNLLTSSIKLLSSSMGRKILKDFQSQHKLIPTEEFIQKHLKKYFPHARIKVEFYNHQLCHASSAYYFSPFQEALVITMDGFGDESFSKVYIARNNELQEIGNSVFKKKYDDKPGWYSYSVGNFYTRITELLGFTPNSDEGKVEALAAYGKPIEELLNNFKSCIKLDIENNSIKIIETNADKYFSDEFLKETIKNNKKENISATIQRFLEDVLLEFIDKLVKKYDIKNLCLAGGVFANVILNMKIFETITPNIYITPWFADDGTATGACVLSMLNNGYTPKDLEWLREKEMPYWGTDIEGNELKNSLEKYKDKIDVEKLDDSWPKLAAKLIVDGKIGAICHGRMEWGPRALGNRSIIADVRKAETRNIINKVVKSRPLFQPFCPSILIEEKERLFEKAYNNKHMTCAFKIKKEYEEKLPSAIHVDRTARVQFVSKEDNPKYYELISEVKNLTGFGVIIDTSFNRHGRTIVEKAKDAIEDFLDSQMDFLIISDRRGNAYLITKAIKG